MTPMRCIPILLLLGASLRAGDGEKDPRVLAEGKAPTPFTADQIRAASPAGRTSLFRISGGGQSLLLRFRFGEGDAEAVRLETVNLSERRTPLAPPKVTRVSWRELQAHASYDENATTIEEATVEVPFGKFDCLLYTLKGARAVQKFYFAKELPGPPVRMVVEANGEVRQTMELLEHRSFDYAKVFGPQAARAGGEIPADWRVEAKVERADETGALRLVAVLHGKKRPDSCPVRIERGPLKGAIFRVARAKPDAAPACSIPLPGPFRMKTGALTVRILSPGSP